VRGADGDLGKALPSAANKMVARISDDWTRQVETCPAIESRSLALRAGRAYDKNLPFLWFSKAVKAK